MADISIEESNEPKLQSTDEQIEKVGTNINRNELQNIPYPKRVYCIIGNEFCERFNYYGMRAILALYLKNKLPYSENDATGLFHGWVMVTYFMCLFGGILSDVWLGKFKTIFSLSIVYSIGSAIVAISAVPKLSLDLRVIILLVGLILIAVGSGGIKPCVAAFGGDQFKLPEQTAQLATYFSIFYFSINLGSLISSSLTPILREDVHCFGDNDCYSLAFGVPAILMFIAIVMFIIGKPTYTYVETSSENMLVQVSKCITNAISTKFREGQKNPRKNLLDYSIDKYGEQLVSDTRALLRILVLYLPLPLFWALFDQQATRWTFQAARMNGDIGFYTIKPDQMQVVNPLLILAFIPLFEAVIYPILHKIGIRRPLQKMVLGGMLTAIAFATSAIVQFEIESSPAKSVHMLWLVPQFFVIALGEVMFSVTGLSFSYEQAPESMKSVVQAFWLLTVAFGNLILMIVAGAALFNSQAHEFLLFSGLMVVDMFIFMGLAYKYKNNRTLNISKEEEHLDLYCT